MPDSNVTIVGNLTRDPELRYTPNGVALLTITMAVNHRKRNAQTDQWDEQVSFFDVTLWRDAAENAASTLQKGARVIATGRLEQRSWDDRNDPTKKQYKIELVDAEVGPSLRWATAQVTRTPRDGASGGDQNRAPAPTQAPPAASSGGYDSYDEEPF
jgi:single-strand DNA-binding protein